MKTIIDFTNKVKSLVDGRMSNIANVETSPSTHPYAVGKQLIFNGLLCKATSAIAVGDTLAVGTNLALSDNVVEQIYSLNQGLTNSLANISHENLLDNPWFTVNQRGFTSLSADGFCYDRWKMQIDIGTVNATANGVEIDATSNAVTFSQGSPVDTKIWNGKDEYTLSVDFTVEAKGSGDLNFFTNESSGVHITNFISVRPSDVTIGERYLLSGTNVLPGDISASSAMFLAWIYARLGWKIIIHSIKFEKGSVSTLAMDTAPNYQQELAKCQRYFYRANMNIYCTYGIAAAWSTTAAKMLYQTPVPMRVRPAITLGDISAFRLINGSTNLPITNAILYGADNTDKFYLELYATTVSGTIYAFYMAATSYIDFSADLL